MTENLRTFNGVTAYHARTIETVVQCGTTVSIVRAWLRHNHAKEPVISVELLKEFQVWEFYEPESN